LFMTYLAYSSDSAIFVRKGIMDGQKEDRPPRSYLGDRLKSASRASFLKVLYVVQPPFFITFLGLLVHYESASGFLRQQFHVGSNMHSAKGWSIRYVICSERTNDKGSVLCFVLCVCTVYHVVEIFLFNVNVQSQTIMITDFWNI
jgi:hypothetical protein